ncbi:hypothetical protein [Streptomyces sp. NBC_01506]|uniref:hypothetical protein n=1 Tax=Streptomyces sp. NBC_01506 TaxID=2903887 RepID=UPI003866AD5E
MKTRAGRVALLTVGVTPAAGGCSSDTADGKSTAGAAAGASKSAASKSAEPSGALVKWAGHMCEATERFRTMKADRAIGVKALADPLGDAPVGAELVAIGAWKVRVSLSETKGTVRNNDPEGAVGEVWTGAGGGGAFGEPDGRELTIKAVAVDKNGAVLKFRTK